MKHTLTYSTLVIFLITASSFLYAQVQLGDPIHGEAIWDRFGKAVSISGDGTRIAVGAPENDGNGSLSGHVRVYDWDGWRWKQAGNDIDGESSNNLSGTDLALSANGNRLAIGAPDNSGNGSQTGHVRVYEWDGSDWVQLGQDIEGQGVGDYFGTSVSISQNGNRLAAGAPGNDTNGTDAGQVRVFEWDGFNWLQIGRDLNGSQQSRMGHDISLSLDGNRVAMGGIGSGNATGWVRVYEFRNGNWSRKGTDIYGPGAGGQFGSSVSISSTGNIVAIGAPNAGGVREGLVRVFRWNGISWVLQGTQIEGEAAGDRFGASVALSPAGNRLAIGASNNGSNGIASGNVKVFRWDGLHWIASNEEMVGDSIGDKFGSSVALSSFGDIMIVGASHNSAKGSFSGQVKMYRLTGHLHTGKVYHDLNKNCIQDSQEPPYFGAKILFEKDGNSVAGYTNHDGIYSVWIDTGTYHVRSFPLAYPYRTGCTGTQSFTLDTSTIGTTSLDFLVKDSIDCPFLTVDINTARIRRCFRGKYIVDYCNKGIKAATNVMIEVVLDENLDFVSTNQSLTSRTGNVLQFQIGTLGAGVCSSFEIDFLERCSSAPGHIHSTTAHISPDSLCLENMPNLKIQPTCHGDTLVYTVKNLSDDFPESFPYSLSHNQTIVKTGSLNLDKGQSETISYFTDNSMKMYQFALAPNDDNYFVATGLNGCQDSASATSTLYLPQAIQPYRKYHCQANIGSYDPNDKQAFPLGEGPNNHIPPNTPLEYKIRFQNTGTDTAFFINILDTLSSHFDMGSLQPGASSHPYRMEYMPPTFSGQQVLKFTFDPILLPDSGANQAGSNGYVTYRIRMKENLPVGTRIDNRAAIYFDYNAPIITNTVFRTLHLPDTNLNITEIEKDFLSFGPALKVYPNPTEQQLYIDLGGEYKDVSIDIVNVMGQAIARKYYARLREAQIDLKGPHGVYLVKIRTREGTSAVVKVLKR